MRDEIDGVTIDKPIYVASVARSGTTILTEVLTRHPDVTSHRYSDFPNVYTPYWRNWLAQRTRKAPDRAVERAHKDRLMVTSESPEAVEEVLWMRFFDHLHDPARSHVLD
ncbi:MAG: sulfotransferase, partial [Wenzhouxiangellaceae bacterium]|nr:sulfotransferase [Wenzhouxiangellaceae bacterium]